MSADDLVETFDDVNEVFVRNPRESSADAFGTERADRTDLDPGALRQASGQDLHGQGESRPWLLAGQRHGNDGAGTFIEHIVTQDKYRTLAHLFMATDRVAYRFSRICLFLDTPSSSA